MTQPGFSTMAMADLLDAFASNDPTPGGGSAAALAGSLGVSLLLMVAGMAKTRTGAPEESADLAAAAARLRPLREQLIGLIDADAAAYAAVLAAYRQPKSTDEEKASRLEAIDGAMRNATEVPLQTLRACAEALNDAPAVVRFGNPNAVADAAVGARILLAAVEGAAMNVGVNLPGLKDAAYALAADAERQSLLLSGRNLAGQVEAIMS